MGLNTGASSICASSIFALLADDSLDVAERCCRLAEILNGCRKEDNSSVFFSIGSLVLPSLLYLLDAASQVQERNIIYDIVLQLRSSRRLRHIYSILASPNQMALNIAKEQAAVELQWSIQRNSGKHIDFDDVGASTADLRAVFAYFQSPTTVLTAQEEDTSNLIFCTQLLRELRRITIACELQTSPHPSSPWNYLHENISSKDDNSIYSSSSAESAHVPITFDSPIFQRATLDMKMTIPILFAALPSAPQDSHSALANHNMPSSMVSDNSSQSFSSPQSIIRSILALLQVPQGEELAFYLLFNIKMILLQHKSPIRLSSLVSEVCKTLVEYLHILQRYSSTRTIIPSVDPIGPFSSQYSLKHADNTISISSTKSLAAHFLGSGFPRRVASVHSTEHSLSNAETSFYHITMARQPGDALHGYNRINLEAESFVASRVESLLHLIASNILDGSYNMFPSSELFLASDMLMSASTKFRVLPQIRLLNIFGEISPSKPYTRLEIAWIRQVGASSDELDRLEWRKFFSQSEPPQSRLINKMSTYSPPGLVEFHLQNKETTECAPETLLETTKDWLEFACRFMAIFRTPTTLLLVQSLKGAVDTLLQILEILKDRRSSEIDSAFELAYCALALFIPDTSLPIGEISTVFAIFSQIISQLSTVESAQGHSRSTLLFRLFQQLHQLQRLELIAHSIQHILGIEVDTVWLVKGLQSKFQACDPGVESSSKTNASKSSNTSFLKQRSIQVSMNDAWNWAVSIPKISHLTLVSLYSSAQPPSNSDRQLDATHSIVYVFDQDDLISGNFTSKALKSSVWKIANTSSLVVESSPIDINQSQDPMRTNSSIWTSSTDPWLSWICLRLLLRMNRNSDFQRFSNAATSSFTSFNLPAGGNHDGVATVLWQLLKQTSRYLCLPLPRHTHSIHSIVFEVLTAFSELTLEGEQRFWSNRQLDCALSASKSANLTTILSSSSNTNICHIEPENLLQVLLLAAIVFCKTPTSTYTNTISPITPIAHHSEYTPSHADSDSIDTDSMDVDDAQMKRSEFLAHLARFNGSSSTAIFNAPLISQDRKRNHIAELRSVLSKTFEFSIMKVLTLSKTLWIEFRVPQELTSATRPQWGSEFGVSYRLATPVFDLIRKKTFDSFVHIRLFSDLARFKSLKKAIFVPSSRLIELDFTFLGGDYRSLVSNYPLLANVDFCSLNHIVRLEHFIIESFQELLSEDTVPHTQWQEERLILVIDWSCRFIHLERTLASIAHAMLSSSSALDMQFGSLSQSVDSTHQNLVHSPERLFNFNLKFLQFPSLFNSVFYKLTLFYYRLSKSELSNLLKTPADAIKEAQADAEDDAESQTTSETSSTTVTSPTTFPPNGDETSEASAQRALTDPFHLRGMPKHKRSKEYVSLHGGRKMTADDTELLIRLQDSALAQLLIDLMILVEDLVDDKGTEVEQGIKIELKAAICSSLQQLFVNDAPLMTLVHHQTYPARAIPWLVEAAPAMHFCLELAPNMLASTFQKATASSDASLQATCFPIKMAAWTVKRFPTQRSLDVATYLLDLFRAAGNSLNSSIWVETMPDLARLVLTFPSLLPAFIDLILIHEGSVLGSNSASHSSSILEASSLSMDPISLDHLSNSDPLSARQVLRHVLSQITQGEHLAPFLRA